MIAAGPITHWPGWAQALLFVVLFGGGVAGLFGAIWFGFLRRLFREQEERFRRWRDG